MRAAIFTAFIAAAVFADMVDEVNPFIGCITQDASSFHGLGKTFPGAATPCGMIQLSPDTITGGDNGPGYSWCMDTIEGFSFTHLSGIGWYGEFGNFQVMPTTGPRVLDREKACSQYSHEREAASPGYYAVTLDRYGVRAEMTAAPRAGMLRFTFPRTERVRVQIDLGRRIGQKERWLKHSCQHVRVVDDRTIEGFMRCPHEDGGWGRGGGKVSYTQHFRCVFSRPFAAFGAWDKDKVFEGARDFSGTNTGFFAEFDVKGGDAVVVRAGLSYVDGAGARLNLERDMPDFDFDAARARARALWRDAFDGVRFEGGTKDERAVFATALYHSLIDPRMIADADGRYMGSDGRVYQSSSFTLRTVFSGWDVFRSEFPLLTIIRPDIVDDTINSMLRWNELGPRNTLPVWDIFGCLSGCMIGNPLIPCMADAWEKGIRGWPAETAWRLAEHTSSVRRNADCGWTPGSLSTTLEYAFDDWCMGKLADMLGKPDRARHYYSRAQCYTNCWSSEVGWMRARRADGSWLPWLGRKVHNNQGTVESNPYQQAWFVPHDVYGLMRLMGGECKFADELEAFFVGVPPDFLWNDYYNHPNEPVHHVPFMFPYCGKPWLTQKWTREICAKAYRNDVRGLCGNDDVGQMSAWYVLAASGLHPVAPGSGIWILTSPVFTKVSFRLDPKYYKGGTFTISAPNASAKNRYVRAAKLNGKELDRMWLTTAEVSGGGVLELEMGDSPETARAWRRPPDVSGVRRETGRVAPKDAATEVWTPLAETRFGDVRFTAGAWTSGADAGALAAKIRVETLSPGVLAVHSSVSNRGGAPVSFKFMTEAVAGFRPARHLIPGVMYNGNEFGSDKVPKGLLRDGEPWVFSYDRSSLPSCTVVEDAKRVFAVFASDADASSLVSSSSLVRLPDGRFSQRIYYPVTEAPVSYTGKKTFTARKDGRLTLAPGESFSAKSFAVDASPRRENFGYADVFAAAWPLLSHEVPRVMSDADLRTNGMAFVNAMRAIDRRGRAAMDGSLQDASHAIGNNQKKPGIPSGLTLADIDADRSRNFFLGEFPRPGRLRRSEGTGIGFTGQCFMSARMIVEDGFRRNDPAAIAFGLDVFDNWLDNYRLPNGLLVRPVPPDAPDWARRADCCHQGWGIVELVRLAELLRSHGMDCSRYLSAAAGCARFFTARWDPKFGFGASWERDGSPGARGGDAGGFVLFGIAKLWEATKEPEWLAAVERALDFYFARDIDRFACGGGAIDCQSVDKESVYPFLETSLILYDTTHERRHLDRAEKAAVYFASWIYCFNALYPPEAEFSQIGYRTCGGTIVGVEHQCLDPYGGVAVAPLVKLGEWTGNGLWRKVAHTVWLNSLQGVATPARRFWHGMERPVGSQNEAFSQTRWTKYRADPDARGNYNDFLGVWMLDFKMASLLELEKIGLSP